MVSQCANPGCGAPFLYFRDGRLFAVPRRNATSIEYFWLCDDCAEQMELEFHDSDRGHGTRVVLRHSVEHCSQHK